MSWNISLWSKAVLLSVCSRASSSSPTRLWFHIQQITSHTVQMSRISYSGLGKASLQQEGRESASRLPGKNMHFDHISNSGAATKATGRRFYFWQHSKKNWRITPSVSHYCQADLLNLRLRHEGDTENIVSSAQFSVMFHQERPTKLLTNLTRGAHPMDGALSAVVCICSHCLRWATCTPPLPPHPLLQVYWLPRDQRGGRMSRSPKWGTEPQSSWAFWSNWSPPPSKTSLFISQRPLGMQGIGSQSLPQ